MNRLNRLGLRLYSTPSVFKPLQPSSFPPLKDVMLQEAFEARAHAAGTLFMLIPRICGYLETHQSLPCHSLPYPRCHVLASSGI